MSMIVCDNCKRVVWAYDHEERALAGLMNHMAIPCPKCGHSRMFDCWEAKLGWQQMHMIADDFGYAWEPDDRNRWFGDRTNDVAALFRQPQEVTP